MLNELANACDVTLVVPEKGNKRFTIKIDKTVWGGKIIRLPVESRRSMLWARYFLVDSLRYRKGKNFKSLRKFRRKSVGWKASLLFGFLALPWLHQLSFRYFLRELNKNPPQALKDYIEREKPNILLHPSVLNGLFINDLVEVSKLKKIPFVVIMNSWDNPSTKKAMAGVPDYLLVWGPQTFEHAQKYLRMDAEKILSFGAAQFDCFREPPEFSRQYFRDLHKIEKDQKVILYAGSSRGADEFDHLCVLEEAIEKCTLDGISVVYRPHPWGGGGKNGKRIVEKTWKNIRMEKSMETYLEMLKQGNPGITLPDYRHTHNTLSSVDLVVSPLSTILIEAALHGVPSICLLPREEDSFGHHERQFDRFQEFFSDPYFFFCEKTNDLVMMISKIVNKEIRVPSSSDIKKNAETYVKPFAESYGKRLLQFVRRVCS